MALSGFPGGVNKALLTPPGFVVVSLLTQGGPETILGPT
jgi:hypothetical protein